METTSLWWEQRFPDSVPIGLLLKLLLNMKQNQIENPVQKAKVAFISEQARELSMTCGDRIFGRTSFSQDPLL